MQVFLVRHAEAAGSYDAGGRLGPGLGEHGRMQAARLGERLRWHDCEPTAIWASPLARAAETAKIVRAALGAEAEIEIETVPDLAHGGDPRAVVAALQRMPENARVVLVGHEPGLSLVGAEYTGVAQFPSLARGQAARIVDRVLRWRFAWDADAPVPAAAAPGDRGKK